MRAGFGVSAAAYRRIVTVALAALLLSSCVHSNERALHDPAPLLSADSTTSRADRLADELRQSDESPFLKAHMTNGDVYVLAERDIVPGGKTIEGRGVHLSALRDTIGTGSLTVPLDSVVLFETNRIEWSGPSLALTVLTGVSAAITVACLANPKACFGSCPTFYIDGRDGPDLRAEGFSSSIAPSLEATDIDALAENRKGGERVRVEMRNEALETHVVRRVDLLAVPRRASERVVRLDDDSFTAVDRTHEPASCTAPEGDCLNELLAADGTERFSPADSTNLATFETISVAFSEPESDNSRLGVVISARQSLLTTYLLYQALAWMGSDAGRWLARIENGAAGMQGLGPTRLLGGIEVEVGVAPGEWASAGEILEHGPLAVDEHTIILPEDLPPGPVNVRIRLAKGTWRLDHVALAELGAGVDPVRLHPSRAVRGDGIHDEAALTALLDPERSLTTLPGDTWTLSYNLPSRDPGDDSRTSYDLFLESEGYYLEWIRREWLAEEDPAQLARLLFSPGRVLRELAPEYKSVEAEMEDMFWRSRYAK